MAREVKKFRLEGLKKLSMGYELLLVKDVDNSPEYDQIINDANVEDELKEAEQDRVERAITKDVGTTKERAPSTRSRLRQVSDAPSEGEYEIDKILKRREQLNGCYEYRVKWKGYSDSSSGCLGVISRTHTFTWTSIIHLSSFVHKHR
jgi:hypothetical protein